MNKTTLTMAGVLLCSMGAPVSADKTLAHSKSLGMSFTAMGEPWCAATVNMRVQAEDGARFATSEYADIVQKLGIVLTRECPQVTRIAITGTADGKTAWSGTAARADNWAVQTSRTQTATTPSSTPGTASKPLRPEAAPSPPGTAATPAPTPTAEKDTALEIAGWKPGGLTRVSLEAGKMTEIPSRKTGCAIRTFMEIRADLHPSFVMHYGDYTCENGYVRNKDLTRADTAKLFYQGQEQSFGRLSGIWDDGYNLRQGKPRQIVSRYRVTSKDNWGREQEQSKLLVWIGEDRSLRAHYFVTYVYSDRHHQWFLDSNLQGVVVLTDNELLKQKPEQAGLAASLAEVYNTFMNTQNRPVNFVITDKMHEAPVHAYRLALQQQDPDASFYHDGRVVKQRGMPWTVEVRNDFMAKREAFAEAERKRAELERQREQQRLELERQREQQRLELERRRAEQERLREEQRKEMERQRLATLRERHRDNVEQQYRQLAEANRYDRLRFYATLKLEPERMNGARIDFTSPYVTSVNPFSRAVAFDHPARYMPQASDGEVKTGPMYMLVKADDGRIEKPYAMTVDYNETGEEIDGWMLIKTAPGFRFRFDDDGRPVFEITVQEAFVCESDFCLEEIDPAGMMRAWYGDEDISFAMAGQE
ncbi:MAG TPA: hypothetical protein VK971_09650 [Thiohalobacter sp.]|nr:hypothetical protein [Thiohalobacter sp.]